MRADDSLQVAMEKPPHQKRSSQRPTNPKVRFTSNVFGTMSLVADVLCFVVAAPLALMTFSTIRQAPVEPQVHLFALALTLGSFLLLRSSRHAYQRSLLDPIDGYSDAAFDVVISSLIASALIWQAGMIENYSRGITLIFVLVLILCLAISRPLLRRMTKSLSNVGQIEQRIAFYGADSASILFTQRLMEAHQFKYLKIIGVADDRTTRLGNSDLPIIPGLPALCDLARQGEVDQVFIAGGRFTRERLEAIVEALSEVCVDVSLIPLEAVEFSPNYRVNLLGSVPVLTLWQRPFRDVNLIIKRAEDLTVGLVALLAFAPILLISALLVRLTSSGPILFVQPRIGFNNEVIDVFKFRTMYADQTDAGAIQTTTKGDPRVTPVGRVLRRLSLDELPQLLNVLQGNMSLVGPRPHATEMKVGERYYHEAVRGYAGRHRVKPGLTGLAQVKGLRGEVRTVERAKRRVELDKYYADNWSLWLDVWILLATVRAVLFDRDAY